MNTYAPRPARFLWVQFTQGAVLSPTAWGAAYDLVLAGYDQGEMAYKFAVPDSMTDGDFLETASLVASSPAVAFVHDGTLAPSTMPTGPQVGPTEPAVETSWGRLPDLAGSSGIGMIVLVVGAYLLFR